MIYILENRISNYFHGAYVVLKFAYLPYSVNRLEVVALRNLRTITNI